MNKLMVPKSIFWVLLHFMLIITVPAFSFRKVKNANEEKEAVKIITTRLVEGYLSKPVNEAEIQDAIITMKGDGSWSDINYDGATEGYPALKHLTRLKSMAAAFSKTGTSFFHKSILKEKVLLGYEFFFNKSPISLNWWFNDIGGPQEYMAGLILLKGRISANLLHHYSSYLKDATDNQSHRGRNRIWVSAITIHKGCIEDNFLLMNKGFLSVSSTLVIEKEQGLEGIKIDNSFHQHRPQLYSGGYGMGFAEDLAALIELCENTVVNNVFSPEKKKLLSEMMLHGHQLFGYRGSVDFGTIGRNISRPNATGNISHTALDKMISIDPDHALDFRSWKNHLEGADFPESFQGNKYFWKSDIMTHHGKNYYLSAKVISTRTVGTEMLNGENLKGFNLPLGATNIMTSGNEYVNIFPVWDWTRIPGTTAVMNQSAAVLPWYLYGSNNFSGGVSNGKIGAIAYEHNYNGVQAKKAYFFMNNAMLCMGAGINALRTQQVITSVNQCLLHEEIAIATENNLSGKIFTDDMQIYKNRDLQWAYHDKVGYVFPEGGNITLKKALQTGSYKSIDNGGSEAALSKPVFSIWFNHGTVPKDESYTYIVMPGYTLADFKDKVVSHGFIIQRNDQNVQAVRNKDNYIIIFYKPETVDLGGGLTISADTRTIVMLERGTNGCRVSVADPTHQQQQVNLLINKKIKLRFILPDGDRKGSTVSEFFRNTI